MYLPRNAEKRYSINKEYLVCYLTSSCFSGATILWQAIQGIPVRILKSVINLHGMRYLNTVLTLGSPAVCYLVVWLVSYICLKIKYPHYYHTPHSPIFFFESLWAINREVFILSMWQKTLNYFTNISWPAFMLWFCEITYMYPSELTPPPLPFHPPPTQL